VGELVRDTLPLALGAAVSPVLFLLFLGLLSGPRPMSRSLACGAGVLTVSVAIAVVVLAGLLGPDVVEKGHRHSTPSAILDLAFGAALLVLALVTAVRKPAAPKPHKDRREDGSARLGRFFAIGLGAMAANVTSIMLYIPGLKEVAVAKASTAEKGAVTIGFILIMLIPVEVPIAFYAVTPKRASAALGRLRVLVETHQRAVRIVVGLGFGAYLIVKGIGELP
jgi:threonine/homoserine/homoserine lactone efflux protein